MNNMDNIRNKQLSRSTHSTLISELVFSIAADKLNVTLASEIRNYTLTFDYKNEHHMILYNNIIIFFSNNAHSLQGQRLYLFYNDNAISNNSHLDVDKVAFDFQYF